MCGIFGCKGKDALANVIKGLKKLEYRGYDSWGVAYRKNSRIVTIKRTGKVSDVNENLFDYANIAIGHTRWATHGRVNIKNAHPHCDCKNVVAVVHNGIIDNFNSLKKTLQNHKFESDTDSEIVPHLIEQSMKSENFVRACSETFKKLKGSFAILVLYENKLVCVKKDCPLVVGVKDQSYFVSSDPDALSMFVDKVYYLNDYDMVIIENGLKIFNLKTNKVVNPVLKSLNCSHIELNKNGYPHFMLKEIYEQSDIIKRLTTSYDLNNLKTVVSMIKKAKYVCLTGCGTAYHAALVAKYLFSRIAKVNVDTVLASEFDLIKNKLNKDSLVIAVSQSGETADVLFAIKSAKRCQSKVACIVNVKDSSLDRACGAGILTNAGKEFAVASTKAFTAQVCIMLLIAYAYINKFNLGLKNLIKLSNILNKDFIDEINNKCNKINIDYNKLFVIGRGLDYPIALEAALKIKEVSYVHAEGFAGGELKHGTIALIEDNVPCIVFACDEKYYDDIINNAIEIKARGGYVIGVSYKNNKVFDKFFYINKTGHETCLLSIIPAQLLAYTLAINKGLNPDYPRNLAKCVTVK